MKENEWFHDYVTPDLVQSFRIREEIYSGKTQFQSVEVIESGGLGRCLILDGKIQSSEWDEFIYHEALVHPPMIAHPNPEKVFIAGGGEGATLREVLAHSSVKRAVMVDIDKEVIDISRRFLPSWHQGSFEDSRLELRFVDAIKYLEECIDKGEKFDVVILDLPEPIEEGPAFLLHTKEFYQTVRETLTPDGIISLQAGASLWGNHRCFTAIINTLKAVFPFVFPYDAFIPSYGGTWGFALASQSISPSIPEEVDGRISFRLNKDLKFYDAITHQRLFSLPKHLREAIDQETSVITTGKPFFIYEPH
jgi:spermidine synthase